MPFGITNATNVTMHNITDIVNLTSGDPTEFFIRANMIIYNGWFFFIILCILGFILFRLAQQREDQPLVNAMYICGALTVLAFIGRAIQIVYTGGVVWSLITDFQMWIFPILAAGLAAIVKFTSDA